MDEGIAELLEELDRLCGELDALVLVRLLNVEDPEAEQRRQRALARAQRALERARAALREAGAEEDR